MTTILTCIYTYIKNSYKKSSYVLCVLSDVNMFVITSTNPYPHPHIHTHTHTHTHIHTHTPLKTHPPPTLSHTYTHTPSYPPHTHT